MACPNEILSVICYKRMTLITEQSNFLQKGHFPHRRNAAFISTHWRTRVTAGVTAGVSERGREGERESAFFRFQTGLPVFLVAV